MFCSELEDIRSPLRAYDYSKATQVAKHSCEQGNEQNHGRSRNQIFFFFFFKAFFFMFAFAAKKTEPVSGRN